MVVVPVSHAPPTSPPHLIRSDGNLECLLGARRGENRRVPKLANMANGVTPPILNHESVSRYEGLDEVGRCQAAVTRQNTTHHGVLFESLA